MNYPIDRRSALSIGAGAIAAAAAATLPTRSSAAKTPTGLVESAPSFEALFPSTRYYEIESRIAGARFAAWVTLPAQYDADRTKTYPIVYQMDGNLFLPATAPFHQGEGDKLSPHIPFIMVSVGYSKRESHAWPWLRIRDLTPPGEAVPDVIRQTVEPAVKAGRLSQDEGRRYLAMFANPAADAFLAFLEQELHPQIATALRVDETDVALWGYSYGGLFSTYVAIERSDLFKCVGAGSPGIVAENSQIFKLYQQAVASKNDYSGRRLHVTLGARELAQPSLYQWIIARGTSELLAQTALHPLPGLKVSGEIIPLETHLTGAVPGWFSFVRACYQSPR
ncbi:esterase [Sphingomonas panacis]|uniref:Acyl-CoA:diacylglycerol acyltransferase n=1 Tax=Sphingomonas panacis TaxID=1560345 RepID=A0A1B3ZA95_9SPHN|nr:alpha/beta hydrolase-fold protein [Sphingomonas panacis]AOH84330.1 esterase [Sphingomonas panacis]